MAKPIENPEFYRRNIRYNRQVDDHRGQLVQNRIRYLFRRRATPADRNEFAPDPFELVSVDQSIERMQKVLNRLARTRRHCVTAFWLWRVDGLLTREIAKRLGIPERTVERNIATVLSELKRAVYDERPLSSCERSESTIHD